MNEIMRTKESYKLGEIKKLDYQMKMRSYFEVVMWHQECLKETNVDEISIQKDKIVFTLNIRDNKIKYIADGNFGTPLNLLISDLKERVELDIILNLINKALNETEIIVFDIGANVGWYYCILNFLSTNKISVYSFEPLPKSYKLLIQNAKLNNLETNTIYNFGFSNREGKEIFYENLDYSEASSMRNLEYTENFREVQLEIKTLDCFVSEKNISKIDFIKCDVEGAELLILQGGMVSIKKYKPIIFLEMLRKWAAKFEYHPNDIIEILKNVGYICCIAIKEQLVVFDTVTDETIATNYFFLHTEKHKDIIDSELVNKGNK